MCTACLLHRVGASMPVCSMLLVTACHSSWPGLCSSLSEEEKAHLRGRLLDLVEQQDQQIAVQVCAGWAGWAAAPGNETFGLRSHNAASLLSAVGCKGQNCQGMPTSLAATLRTAHVTWSLDHLSCSRFPLRRLLWCSPRWHALTSPGPGPTCCPTCWPSCRWVLERAGGCRAQRVHTCCCVACTAVVADHAF